jgi:hypothetical protein
VVVTVLGTAATVATTLGWIRAFLFHTDSSFSNAAVGGGGGGGGGGGTATDGTDGA